MLDNLIIPSSILGIPNIIIESVEFNSESECIITVKSSKKEIKCNKCHKPTSRHGYGRMLRLRHLAVFGHKTYIQISPARGICKNCNDTPTTTEDYDWHSNNSSCTKAYERHILLSLINSTITDVSVKEDIGYKSIEGIVDRNVEAEVNWSEIQRLGLLGIDEISLKKGYKDYLTIFTSKTEKGIKILKLIRGRKKTDIKAFLKSIPSNLKKTIVAVCTDMYDGYINAAREELGENVPVVADRYHVSKLYRKCLSSVRKSELKKLKKTLSSAEYKKLKPAISLLCRRKEYEFSDNEKEQLKPLFEAAPKIKTAYTLSLKLTAIYNSHLTKKEAEQKVEEWIQEVENSKITSFNNFIKTLQKYKNEICNYFINRHSSGFVEGFNNKVKVLKRRCYGIFNIRHLFQRIFLDFSGYDFINKIKAL